MTGFERWMAPSGEHSPPSDASGGSEVESSTQGDELVGAVFPAVPGLRDLCASTDGFVPRAKFLVRVASSAEPQAATAKITTTVNEVRRKGMPKFPLPRPDDCNGARRREAPQLAHDEGHAGVISLVQCNPVRKQHCRACVRILDVRCRVPGPSVVRHLDHRVCAWIFGFHQH